MTSRDRSFRPRCLTILAISIAMAAAGCGQSTVSSEPSGGSPPAGSPLVSPGGSQATVQGPSGSPPGVAASPTGPATSASPPIPPEQGGPAFTAPPEMPAQDDDVCLAIVSRSAAEDALGRTVGTVEAQATDPTAQLTCTYPIESGGWLLLTMSAADVENEYETDLVVATSHDQVPLLLDGIGDRAFYGSATSSAPEQVVFTKGPVIVRLWNQTDAAVGQAAFADLAGSAADAIEAEVRP